MHFKTFLKYLLVCLGVVALAGFFGAWWLWINLPTTPPQSIERLPTSTVIGGQCLQQNPQIAYAVSARVMTRTETQVLYQSLLNFNVQMAARGEHALAGLATQISIKENQQAATQGQDVRFLAKASGDDFLVFDAFNSLSLPAKHPMSVLSQLLKNLSLGNSAEVYRFAYDEMQRIYRYQHKDDSWLRTVSAPGQMKNQVVQPIWQVQVENCLPKKLVAEEEQLLKIGDDRAFFRVRIEATRIDSFTDLSALDFPADANAKNSWQTLELSLNSTKPVQNSQEAWAVFSDFAEKRNVQALMQASTYLVEHMPVTELAQSLQKSSADNANRDLLFGLGLLKTPESARYLVDLMQALPSGSAAVEIHKVRAMVALSGHSQAGSQAYQAFAQMVENPNESANVRHNAFINMGSTLKHQRERGEDTQNLAADLNEKIQAQLKQDASAALFAASNLGVAQIKSEITQAAVEKLNSVNPKERLASAMLLSQDAKNYDLLYAKIQSENSPMIKQAIVDGLLQTPITDTQKQALK